MQTVTKPSIGSFKLSSRQIKETKLLPSILKKSMTKSPDNPPHGSRRNKVIDSVVSFNRNLKNRLRNSILVKSKKLRKISRPDSDEQPTFVNLVLEKNKSAI